MKKRILYGLCVISILCVTYILFPWSSQDTYTASFLMEDVEALSKNGEVTPPKFKTWVDSGSCYDKNTRGELVKVDTYRICGEVSLGFEHDDDCTRDEDCEKGHKI